MAQPRIALIVDSCTDALQSYVPDVKLYTLPLTIIYRDRVYQDKIDIDSETVCERLAEEIPTTSLPTIAQIRELFAQVLADGYEQAVIVTISSGLSGTHNAIKLALEQTPALQHILIDTKNIAIGSGFTAIAAGHLIKKGVPFNELEARLSHCALDAKVFFCVETLEYLKAGGRIGEVVYLMGSVLNIKPIISCNDKGVYYVAKTARGRKAALKKALDLAKETAEKYRSYNIAVMYAGAKEDAEHILANIKEHFPRVKHTFRGTISPVLIVHTGPGLLGIGVQGLDSI
ncbi:MAG: DegV family protein [Coriobacteriales bacterium]|jgi:DegV family protein with EDD domain|nr:DegV family protein [Coriobacteriales bacterium]